MKCRHWLVLIIWANVIWVPPLSAQPFSSKYDVYFRVAMKRYLPLPYEIWGADLLKAQAWQESRFDPQAESPVGARGVMQFMPDTWHEVSQKMQWQGISASSASHSIYAGAWYMARMRRIWKARRSERDRYDLALSSYNAGAGNLIKAQQLCAGVSDYAGIVQCLPEVTGEHSKETLNYVRLIWRAYRKMRQQ